MTTGENLFNSWSEYIKILIDKGKDINTFHSSGQTLLIAMAREGDKKAIKTLFDAGANLEQRDFYDKTALMHAVETGQEQVTKLLIDAGANVNARNYQGRTALMYAAYNNNLGIIEMLTNADANVNITDDTGYSTLDYLYRKKQTTIRDDCLNHLKKHKAKSGSEIINTKESWFKRVASFDEFEELKDHKTRYIEATSGLLKNNPVTDTFFLFLFANGFAAIFAHVIIIPSWIALYVWGRWLLRTFPSVSKIILSKKDTITNNPTSLRDTEIAKDMETIMSAAARQDNLEFVSNVLELGSHQLKNIHVTNADQQAKKMRTDNTWSRFASTGLAVSIFVLYCMLYGPALFQAPFITGIGSLSHLILILIIPFWIIVALAIERRLRLGRLKRVQAEKDRLAGEISNVLKAEDLGHKNLPTDFVLYLRAFITTNKFIMNGLDLETILAYSIAPALPVVTLGQPGEHVGAGRIQTSDEHWQEEILRLFEMAKLIVIIPSHRRGTLWEISNLKERNYLSKTVFVMPPEMTFYGKPYSRTWNMAVKAAAKHGIELPRHFSKGLIFTLNELGRLENHAPFSIEEFTQELLDLIHTGDYSDYSYDDDRDDDSGNDGDNNNADDGNGNGAISGITGVAGVIEAISFSDVIADAISDGVDSIADALDAMDIFDGDGGGDTDFGGDGGDGVGNGGEWGSYDGDV